MLCYVGWRLTSDGGRYMTVAQCAQQMLEIEAEKNEGGMCPFLYRPRPR